MKKFYEHPHVETLEAFEQDVLTASTAWSDYQEHDFGQDDPYARARVF